MVALIKRHTCIASFRSRERFLEKKTNIHLLRTAPILSNTLTKFDGSHSFSSLFEATVSVQIIPGPTGSSIAHH